MPTRAPPPATRPAAVASLGAPRRASQQPAIRAGTSRTQKTTSSQTSVFASPGREESASTVLSKDASPSTGMIR